MSMPSELECPITHDIMSDPVIASDDYTYERTAITSWLSNHGISPMTREPMQLSSLRINYAIKSQIDRLAMTESVQVEPFINQPLSLKASQFTYNDQPHLHLEVTPVKSSRQPVAMVIVLDNSGSMGDAACSLSETGNSFSSLDLCKHTIRTVAGLLNENDMLGIVSFSTTARTVLKPVRMTAINNDKMEYALKSVNPESQTNIWAGLEMANALVSGPELANRNIAVVLLTDGLPNVNPPRGILETYKMLNKPNPYILSTFGFGYNLDSKLLSDLATYGQGSFCFIPDYSMVATVFINWAASVLSTSALNQTICINYNDGTSTTVNTGLIQSEQSRNLIINLTKPVTSVTMNSSQVPSESTIDEFQNARYDMMLAIKTCMSQMTNTFGPLYEKYRTSTNTNIIELMKDIDPSADTMGQVYMAPTYYEKWGKHYLRAYLSAHMNEQCMNFKDAGLQMYGGTLFHELQQMGDTVFAHLPALTATATNTSTNTSPQNPTTLGNMMRQVFNNPFGGCWAPGSLIRMADNTRKPIEDVLAGDKVWTLTGTANVMYALKLGTLEKTQVMCQVGSLWITPWHPVLINNLWTLPESIARVLDRMVNSVYNLILDTGHIVDVENVLTVTLGHGFTGPVIGHPFFGSKTLIIYDLASQPGFNVGRPVYVNLKVKRQKGLIVGWYDDVNT